MTSNITSLGSWEFTFGRGIILASQEMKGRNLAKPFMTPDEAWNILNEEMKTLLEKSADADSVDMFESLFEILLNQQQDIARQMRALQVLATTRDFWKS